MKWPELCLSDEIIFGTVLSKFSKSQTSLQLVKKFFVWKLTTVPFKNVGKISTYAAF